jgi:hypothetical protein
VNTETPAATGGKTTLKTRNTRRLADNAGKASKARTSGKQSQLLRR